MATTSLTGMVIDETKLPCHGVKAGAVTMSSICTCCARHRVCAVFCQGPPAVVSGDQATEPYMSKAVRTQLSWDLGQE